MCVYSVPADFVFADVYTVYSQAVYKLSELTVNLSGRFCFSLAQGTRHRKDALELLVEHMKERSLSEDFLREKQAFM